VLTKDEKNILSRNVLKAC